MAFWKPGTFAPGSLEDRADACSTDGAGVDVQQLAASYVGALGIAQHRQRLPIASVRTAFLYAVETTPVTLVVADTATGKSTQLPQFLHEAGWTDERHAVVCTQPRRIAATSIAQRVAEEMGVDLGAEVGYHIRFEDCTSSNTRVKFMTDGLLLRELLSDPLLERYSVIIIDEAHERNMYTDLLLGVLKVILKRRPDLRLVVSSATLNVDFFQEYFVRSDIRTAVVAAQGRTFPVDLHYLVEPCENYLNATIEAVMHIHEAEQHAGDILVFLTGREEIDIVVSKLKILAKRSTGHMALLPMPLYAGLSLDVQQRVFAKAAMQTRKVVISTNIAEASVTIDGVVFVVDCGLAKIKSFDPKTLTESLIIAPISKASAQQRAGRAGRTRPGKVYRLYREDRFNTMDGFLVPEIQRSNLSMAVLQLKALGLNVLRFDYPSPPPAEIMIRSLEVLYALGAIDDATELTADIGKAMAEMPPINPMLAKMLLASREYKCSEDMVSIVAMASVEGLFGSRSDEARRVFAVEEGDFLTYLNVYRAYASRPDSPKWSKRYGLNVKALKRAAAIRRQLVKHMERLRIPMTTTENSDTIRKCVLSGLFPHCARLVVGRGDGGEYQLIRSGTGGASITLRIHPDSVLFNKRAPACIVFQEVVESSQYFMRDVTTIDPNWLLDVAPEFFKKSDRL